MPRDVLSLAVDGAIAPPEGQLLGLGDRMADSGAGVEVVKVWLALLLGGFELRQEDGAYFGAGLLFRQ
jgi:hypothetical protein